MRTAGALLYVCLVAMAFASAVDRSSLLWAFLVWTNIVAFVAALFRVHAVVNAPKADE